MQVPEQQNLSVVPGLVLQHVVQHPAHVEGPGVAVPAGALHAPFEVGLGPALADRFVVSAGARQQVVEVGQIAAGEPGQSRRSGWGSHCQGST